MENSIIETTKTETFAVNNEIRSYLAETAKWGNILAIFGYIFMGLMILLALLMTFAFSSFSEEANFPFWALGLLYLIIGALYWFPVTYLYRFSARMTLAVRKGESQLYTEGFANLKSLFKFFGIFTIVMLVMYGLMIVIAIPLSIFLQ